ncbi:MAG TPA: fumarylacetoacetate hydrolase family protein [Bryobacteraceae bacterium]|nr:fumarylacetoacetate hydrolase family protein [Bryobacteraceae bacterium]
MKLYRTRAGSFVEQDDAWYRLSDVDWQALITRDDLAAHLESQISRLTSCAAPAESALLAPIGEQEVWAAGVTYYRSRTARMEESQAAGGGDFYDRVYHAERPELFFKATPHRVVGPGAAVHIRGDSRWNVPEPELTILLSPSGKLIGYTIGNDMSSRDIEGENPLYLPQAKVYDRSCALGPCILVASEPLPPETRIALEIARTGQIVFFDETKLSQLKRSPATLTEYLFRENTFPNGCFLLTGTGIVPPDEFTLQKEDRVRITIDGIGTLSNLVE